MAVDALGERPVLACVGGGQLGLMLALSAAPLGVRCRFLDPKAGAPASGVGGFINAAFDDADALEGLRDGAAAVTYEFENIPEAALARLESGDGAPLRPGRASLAAAQDRLREKRLFGALGVPTAAFEGVGDLAGLRSAGERLGYPLIVKTARGGYDGKGQWRLEGASALERHWQEIERAMAAVAGAPDAGEAGDSGGHPAIAEEVVGFDRELSVAVTRDAGGAMVSYPMPENGHRGGVLRVSVSPASGLSAEVAATARGYAEALAEHLGHVGTLCLELFDCGGRLLANEFAPRVHNSHHWTIEACGCSQFENHARAALGLPLGGGGFGPGVGASAMVNLIGGHPGLVELLGLAGRVPSGVSVRPYLYGKSAKPGRKLGHVTLTAAGGAELAEAVAVVERAVGGG